MSPALLTKALLRAAETLQLTSDLASLLQIDPDQVATLQSGARSLDPHTQEWTRAQKIVSLFRTLISLLGTADRARAWLTEPNQALNARPLELLRTAQGERVHRYLDAVQKHELLLPRSADPS